jgi:hypothetical protein
MRRRDCVAAALERAAPIRPKQWREDVLTVTMDQVRDRLRVSAPANEPRSSP